MTIMKFFCLDTKNKRKVLISNICLSWRLFIINNGLNVDDWTDHKAWFMDGATRFAYVWLTDGEGAGLMFAALGNPHVIEQTLSFQRVWGGVTTLWRFPLESPRKAMLCPSATLTATAVRRAAEVCHEAVASRGARLAIGLGVWSDPHGYALRVFCERTNVRSSSLSL